MGYNQMIEAVWVVLQVGAAKVNMLVAWKKVLGR